jgi:hypothetical protein
LLRVVEVSAHSFLRLQFLPQVSCFSGHDFGFVLRQIFVYVNFMKRCKRFPSVRRGCSWLRASFKLIRILLLKRMLSYNVPLSIEPTFVLAFINGLLLFRGNQVKALAVDQVLCQLYYSLVFWYASVDGRTCSVV